MLGPYCPLLLLQIPYKVEVARSCVDCDSIGELLCKRAEKLKAAVLLMAKHKRGALKEVRTAWRGKEMDAVATPALAH